MYKANQCYSLPPVIRQSQSEGGGGVAASFQQTGCYTARRPGTVWSPWSRRPAGLLGALHKQTKKHRVVSKHGRVNIVRESREQHRLLKDFFTTMIDLPWSWTLLSFAASFYLSWLVFAVAWYLVALLHGDLRPGNSPGQDVCVEARIIKTYQLEARNKL